MERMSGSWRSPPASPSGAMPGCRWCRSAGSCCAIPVIRFDPQALLCTDVDEDPVQIVRWFVQRWQVEVTFREVRDHLGVETQRQWSDKAIARTTPCLLGLFSIVTLLGTRVGHPACLRVSATAWYHKKRPTFSDTLAAARRQFWREQGLLISWRRAEAAKLRPALC